MGTLSQLVEYQGKVPGGDSSVEAVYQTSEILPSLSTMTHLWPSKVLGCGSLSWRGYRGELAMDLIGGPLKSISFIWHHFAEMNHFTLETDQV